MLDDLQKLPPQALIVIRFLATCEHAAAEEIATHTGLSERAFGKAIRALVTRRFAEMPDPGVYRLSARGREVLDALEPAPLTEHSDVAVPSVNVESTPGVSERRLSVLLAREWVRHQPAKLMIGFDAAPDAASGEEQRLVLRVQAPGCLVEPAEHALEVSPRKPAGPVQFRLTPHEGRTIRVRVEVYRDEVLLGGLFFEVAVNELPTLHSAQFHALGAKVTLQPRA